MATVTLNEFEAPCGAKVYSRQVLKDLIIGGRSWDDDASFAAGPADRIVLTEDGKGYIAEWSVTSYGTEIYCEVRDRAKGMTFHGWIDSATRKIIQAG